MSFREVIHHSYRKSFQTVAGSHGVSGDTARSDHALAWRQVTLLSVFGFAVRHRCATRGANRCALGVGLATLHRASVPRSKTRERDFGT
jgi:hypothetical protein